MCTEFTEWLNGVEEMQAALAPTDEAAFLSSEVSLVYAYIHLVYTVHTHTYLFIYLFIYIYIYVYI